METLSAEDYQWARRIGLTDERIRFLLACPKYTKSGVIKGPREPKPISENHHLQKLGNCFWFRLRRRKKLIVESLGSDVVEARRKRDEILAAFDAGQPVPYINT